MPTIAEIRQKYPQYGDMSDDQLGQALHAKYYADIPYDQFASKVGLRSEPPASTQDTILRNTALAGRAVGQGVFSTLSAVPDALIGAENAVTGGINKVFGTNIPQAETYSQTFSRALDQAGAFQPETKGEKLASAGIQGGAGALSGAGILNAATKAPAMIENSANATRVALSGASGGVSAEVARQKGIGPIGQFVANLVGSLAPGAVEAGARAIIAAPKVATTLAQPLTRQGQEQVAANVLANQAEDPQAAEAALQAHQDIVPGSQTTTGPASRDIGLLATEKALRGRNPVPFGVRNSEQNLARQQALDSVAGTPSDIAAAKAARDATTGPMREASLNAGGTVDVAPVMSEIDATLAGPIGKRDVSSQALTWVKAKLEGETDPAKLYAVRQDIGDAMAGKLGGDQSKFRLARSQLMDVRANLDDAIEAAAPGFKAYLDRYASMSKPIDQMKALQYIQTKSALTSSDITTGRDFLSPAKFARNLQSAAEDGVKLTPDQAQVVNAVKSDLDMGAAINSPLIRASGSDTFQNLSIANAIGSGAAKGNLHPALIALTKPLKWLYKAPDEQITEILTQAMLDPKLAARLLQRATPNTVSQVSSQLRQLAIANGIAITSGAVATPLQSQSQERRQPPSQ